MRMLNVSSEHVLATQLMFHVRMSRNSHYYDFFLFVGSICVARVSFAHVRKHMYTKCVHARPSNHRIPGTRIVCPNVSKRRTNGTRVRSHFASLASIIVIDVDISTGGAHICMCARLFAFLPPCSEHGIHACKLAANPPPQCDTIAHTYCAAYSSVAQVSLR